MHSFIASHITKTKTTLHIWIIDSGAIDHICKSLTLMHNTTALSTLITISLPNGQTTKVYITGSVKLSPSLTIHNVFYIPTFTYNLISISQLLHMTLFSVTFTHNKFIFQGHDGSTTHGTLHGGLYLLNTTTNPTTSIL